MWIKYIYWAGFDTQDPIFLVSGLIHSVQNFRQCFDHSPVDRHLSCFHCHCYDQGCNEHLHTCKHFSWEDMDVYLLNHRVCTVHTSTEAARLPSPVAAPVNTPTSSVREYGFLALLPTLNSASIFLNLDPVWGAKRGHGGGEEAERNTSCGRRGVLGPKTWCSNSPKGRRAGWWSEQAGKGFSNLIHWPTCLEQ